VGDGGQARRGPPQLETRAQADGAAVERTHTVSAWPPYGGLGQARACGLIAALPPAAWQRLSCGEGAQGARACGWACRRVRPARPRGWVHAVPARRHPTRPDELASYLAYAPEGTPPEESVRVAGTRWAVEDTIKLAKGQGGLDHYEVRSWAGWHRHIPLALRALAILAAEAARARGGSQPAPKRSAPSACRSCVG